MPFQINPQVQTLNALLAIPNEQFVIPPYQRRYSWQRKQVIALFQDINSLSLDQADNDGHFFGTLLLHSFTHTVFNKLEVVDGQQRLTTLSILLKSLQKAYRNSGNLQKANSINTFLKCSNFQDGLPYNKLILGNLDSNDYNIIINEGNFNDITNQRLKDAALTFDELLDGLINKGELIDDFWQKMMGTAVIIRLDVGAVRDAYKLFETINNRGLKLSATDIIKNLLFGHASKLNDAQILDNVKNIWAEIISNLDGINNNNTDVFFRRYFCSLLRRRVTANGLIQEFKIWYRFHVEGADVMGLFNDSVDIVEEDSEEDDNENIELEVPEDFTINKINILEFISKILNASKAYHKLSYSKHDNTLVRKEIESLNKIQCEPSYIFLMQFMQLDTPDNLKRTVINMVSSLMLRRHICKKQTGETDQIFSTLVKTIDFIEDQEVFLQQMKGIIFEKEHYPSDEEFKLSFLKYEFKGKAEQRARAILEQYNYSLGGGNNELYIADSSLVHLEHIIPQKINTQKSKSEFGNWEEYLGINSTIKHKTYVSRIGNLTLLAAPLNMGISNNPFDKKKYGYAQSEITMTRNLLQYPEFKFSEVESRGELIALNTITHWRIV
jgi:uncharacterized protein with ParB-like and HNH nuclease domain